MSRYVFDGLGCVVRLTVPVPTDYEAGSLRCIDVAHEAIITVQFSLLRRRNFWFLFFNLVFLLVVDRLPVLLPVAFGANSFGLVDINEGAFDKVVRYAYKLRSEVYDSVRF